MSLSSQCCKVNFNGSSTKKRNRRDLDLEENSPGFLLWQIARYISENGGVLSLRLHCESGSIQSEKPCHYSYSETGALYQQFDAQFLSSYYYCSTAICNLMVGISFYRQNRELSTIKGCEFFRSVCLLSVCMNDTHLNYGLTGHKIHFRIIKRKRFVVRDC